jgi:hypothetical protein
MSGSTTQTSPETSRRPSASMNGLRRLAELLRVIGPLGRRRHRRAVQSRRLPLSPRATPRLTSSQEHWTDMTRRNAKFQAKGDRDVRTELRATGVQRAGGARRRRKITRSTSPRLTVRSSAPLPRGPSWMHDRRVGDVSVSARVLRSTPVITARRATSTAALRREAPDDYNHRRTRR